MADDRVIATSRGKELAEEYGIKFFETSAKAGTNVKECFHSLARDIVVKKMDLLGDDDKGNNENVNLQKTKDPKKGCCNII